jgi:hypothetical protein
MVQLYGRPARPAGRAGRAPHADTATGVPCLGRYLAAGILAVAANVTSVPGTRSQAAAASRRRGRVADGAFGRPAKTLLEKSAVSQHEPRRPAPARAEAAVRRPPTARRSRAEER